MQQKCDGCEALEARLKTLETDCITINTRLARIEHSHAAMRAAFTLNDLGKPDYDGHRQEHNRRATDEKVVDSYKQSAIKDFLKVVVGGVVTLLMLGIPTWLKDHLK